MKADFIYEGDELELFSQAKRWKHYVAGKIKHYISGDVAEVGAGPGHFTTYLLNKHCRTWTCIEPDARFAKALERKKDASTLRTEIINGTLASVDIGRKFDSLIYLDVLEHIKNDSVELSDAATHLNTGGYLVVLCPAFNFLYSPFDKAIGHYRRYTKKTLLAVFPPSMKIIKAHYLDSAGFMASGANKLLLRQTYPTKGQIRLWDRLLVPVSYLTDFLFSKAFGRSILIVAQKTGLQ